MSELYNEKYRPQYHFSAKKNWINDPNGLVYYKGTYHLFYQHQPDVQGWGPMCWGHATSTDMLHWEEQEIAIYPTENYSSWSGSGIVDKKNVSGLKDGEDDPILLFFTAHPTGQKLSYSTDGGKTFKVYDKTVLPNKDSIVAEDRDPKVFWHEETQKWIMILYTESLSVSNLPSYGFFSSDNLLDWKYESEVERCYECPDMVELPINGDKSNTKWVILCCNGDYLVGDFDGHKFTHCQELNISQRNYPNYASQTWSNMPDDRCVQIAWLICNTELNMPFKNQLTIPVELTLRQNGNKYELLKNPIKELETLREEVISISDVKLENSSNLFKEKISCYSEYDMEIEFEYNPFARMYFSTPFGDICYISHINALEMNTKSELLYPDKNNIVKFRILADRSSLEIFGDEGRLYMCFDKIPETRDLSISSTHNVNIKSVKIYKLKSTWK